MECFDILTRQHVSLMENVLYSVDDVYCLYTNRTEFYQNLMEWFEEGGWNLLSSNLKWSQQIRLTCSAECPQTASSQADSQCHFFRSSSGQPQGTPSQLSLQAWPSPS